MPTEKLRIRFSKIYQPPPWVLEHSKCVGGTKAIKHDVSSGVASLWFFRRGVFVTQKDSRKIQISCPATVDPLFSRFLGSRSFAGTLCTLCSYVRVCETVWKVYHNCHHHPPVPSAPSIPSRCRAVVVKTIRADAGLGGGDRNDGGLLVIHLVRDPRAVIHSQIKTFNVGHKYRRYFKGPPALPPAEAGAAANRSPGAAEAENATQVCGGRWRQQREVELLGCECRVRVAPHAPGLKDACGHSLAEMHRLF